MSVLDRRLDKLTPALTATERATLVLQSWKREEREDPLIRQTMPPQQIDRFNQLIELMNAVNFDLAPAVVVLLVMVEKLDVRYGWLLSMAIWGLNVAEIADYIRFHVPEPITESAYRAKVQASRAEFVPIQELAEEMAEDYDGRSGDDFTIDEDSGERIVTDAAWKRVVSEKKAELTQMVESGNIVGKRKGRRLLVQVGSVYDWLGQEVPVAPEWGFTYDVRPAEESEAVERARWARDRARREVEASPRRFAFQLPPSEDMTVRPRWDGVARALAQTTVIGIQNGWLELRAMEQVLDEAAAEFGGEDVARPRLRNTLSTIRAMLVELHENASQLVEPFELPEPDDDDLERVRTVLRSDDG